MFDSFVYTIIGLDKNIELFDNGMYLFDESTLK